MSFSAPAFSTNASVRAVVRLKTAMRLPFSAMLSARLEPIDAKADQADFGFFHRFFPAFGSCWLEPAIWPG